MRLLRRGHLEHTIYVNTLSDREGFPKINSVNLRYNLIYGLWVSKLNVAIFGFNYSVYVQLFEFFRIP